MEAAGLASSIISILDLTAKIVMRSREYMINVQKSPEFLRNIENQLPLLAKCLEAIKRQALGLRINNEIAFELSHVVDNAFKELQRLDQYVRMLKPEDRTSSLARLDRAVKSVIKYDAKIETSMTKLRGYLDTLTLYQSSISAGKTDDIAQELQAVKRAQEKTLTKAQIDELKQWIDGAGRDDYIDDCISRKVPGTCDWIFKTSAYTEWQSQLNSSKSKFLWVHGPPGFGKTFVSATILSQLAQTDESTAAVFWTSEGKFANSSLNDIPRSWIAQVIAQDESLCERLETVKARTKTERANSKDIWQCLQVLLRGSVRPVTLVLDGLDEYQQQQSRRQEQLLRSREASLKYSSVRDFLQELKTNISGIACRLVCVSQQEAEIQAELTLDALASDGVQSFEHNITQEDVKEDVKTYAAFMIEAKLPKKTANLKTDLVNLVTTKAEGQMLWISLLQRDTSFLRPSFGDKKLRSIVESTPPGLDHIYQANLDRILALPDGDRSRALRMLQWIMHALRPLSVHELVEAILIEPDDDDTNDGDEFPNDELPENPDEEDVFGEIKTLCGNFVTFDIDETMRNPQYWKLRFSHSSVRAFLARTLPSDIYGNSQAVQVDQGGRSIIGGLCLRYLSYQNVWPEQVKDSEVGNLSLPEHPFLTYAATYWPLHLTENNRAQMEPLMSSFFRLHYENFNNWQTANLGVKDLTKAGLAEKAQWSYKGRLAFAASLGAKNIVEELCQLGDEINPKQSFPLYCACGSGSVSTVQLLLDRGALLEKSSSLGWRPLHRAAWLGKIDVIKYLIDKGVDVNAASNTGFTGLHSAAYNGHEDVVNALIAAGADILRIDNNGCHALYHAVQQKHKKTANVLISKKEHIGQMINHITDGGFTPLAAAAWNGDKETSELLLQNGADPTQICDYGTTPLFKTAQRGHHDVFVLLLKSCDNVSDVINKVTELYGHTLLHAAVYGKNIEIVKVLLENGADVSRHDNDYYTALDWAVRGGSKDIVELLLQKMSEVSAFKFWNPLMDAAGAGNVDMVRMLLDKGLDISATTPFGHNALMMASRWGHHEVVQILLDSPEGKKIINTKDPQGWSSLLWACEYGRAEVVRVLLEAGADSAAITPDGGSCLDGAAYSGNLSTVSILLEKCGSAAFPEKAVLHSAAESGNAKMFDLLRKYYSINAEKLESGWTVLHAAARGGNVDIIKTVLTEGLEDLLQIRDHRRHLSLYNAIMSGKIDAVKLLLQKYSEHNPSLKFETDDVLEATYVGVIDNVKALYNNDPDSFKTAFRGRWTPLYIAFRRGWEDVVTFLTEKGFKVTNLNGASESCVHAYAYSGFSRVARFLNEVNWSEALSVRDVNGMTPLLVACESGVSDAFRRFSRYGAVVHDNNNGPWKYAKMFDKGCTSLHYAVRSGSAEIVKLIIEACGADLLTLKTPLYTYPVHEAIYHDFMVEFLLEHGASLDVQNVYKQTPLFTSIALSQNLCLTVLLRHGAGKIEREKDSQIMAYAACNYFFPTLKLLHKDGFKLESGLTDGQTLLHIAASRGCDDNVEYLTEQEFDWDAKDDHGWTAQDCALMSAPVPAKDAEPEELKKLDLAYLPPTKWASRTSEASVFKTALEEFQIVLQASSNGTGDENPPMAFTLTADHYLLPTPSQSYFEVTIDECPPSSGIAVGLDVFIGEHHRPLGVGFHSMALYGDDGTFSYAGATSWKYNNSFGQGDTIGCGIDYVAQIVFFTKNGKCLGKAYGDVKGRFTPAISTIEKNMKVTGNFGQRPFAYNIESHGYGDKSCDICYGSGRYISIWDLQEWTDPESDSEDED